MTQIYKIVEAAKKKQNIESDNAFAIAYGFTRQNINDWKTGRSEPKGLNMLKLIKAANMTIDDALILMTEQPHQRELILEAGFVNLNILLGMSAASLGALTLLKMSALPYELIAASFIGANLMYYVKLNQCYMRRSLTKSYSFYLAQQRICNTL